MTEHEKHDYICWAGQQEPARITAIGPETAAREYAVFFFTPSLGKLVPLDSPDRIVREVTVMEPDGSHSRKIRVTLSLESRLLTSD